MCFKMVVGVQVRENSLLRNFNVIINRSRQSIINFYHIKIDTKVGFTQSNIVTSDKNNEGSSLHTRLIKDNVM